MPNPERREKKHKLRLAQLDSLPPPPPPPSILLCPLPPAQPAQPQSTEEDVLIEKILQRVKADLSRVQGLYEKRQQSKQGELSRFVDTLRASSAQQPSDEFGCSHLDAALAGRCGGVDSKTGEVRSRKSVQGATALASIQGLLREGDDMVPLFEAQGKVDELISHHGRGASARRQRRMEELKRKVREEEDKCQRLMERKRELEREMENGKVWGAELGGRRATNGEERADRIRDWVESGSWVG